MASKVRPSATPDRLFARATALALAAGLATLAATGAVLWRAGEGQARATALALAAADEAAAARSVTAALERLAVADGVPARADATRFVWALDRLQDLDDRRIALTPGLAAAEGPIGAAAAAAHAGGAPAGASAEALKGDFESRIVPQLDLIATRSRTAADASARQARATVVGTLAVELLVAAIVFAAFVLPARRRIDAWVTRTAAAERESRFRLLHDPLTGMPNAAYLQAYLARIAAAAGRAARQTAVIRVDLDRFRALREALGQDTCDEVLRIAGQRIRKSLRGGDFAAHLGQDDFAIVAPELESEGDVARIAARVQAALSKPFSIRGGARQVTCTVGVTLLSDDRAEPERMLANAEIALAAAQAAGPGSVRYFREDLRLAVERREALFAELLHGLDAGEIVPHFQPQLDLASGGFAGFEALARWQHPVHGLLEPQAFLDFAEQTDLSERIGEQVLSRTLEALRSWDAAGLAVPRVGVNFALAELRNPRLIERIKWEAERFGVEPDRIAIEVLETVLIKSDADIVVRNLRGLASAGFHVELDDFGTGHASIANLRRFMVNRIKIDRSFVAGIEASEELRTLTASMIAMARALGIATLAEGVETEAARATLADLGCGQYQGYLAARPMGFAETLPWLGACAAATAGGAAGGDPITP
ncbi:MAG: bifunctional diguanylate cyclase/phosphodiesterase [Amaricoccus sp.]